MKSKCLGKNILLRSARGGICRSNVVEEMAPFTQFLQDLY